MHQPHVFVDYHQPLVKTNLMCLPFLIIVGFQDLVEYATKVGFLHNESISSLFTFRRDSNTTYILIYVDVIILTASSDLFQRIISSLSSKIDITDLRQGRSQKMSLAGSLKL